MSTATDPTALSSADTTSSPLARIARFSIDQYDRMIAAGVFETGLHRERLELIHGVICPMSPIGPPHENVLDYLNEWSVDHAPREKVRIRIQCSITLPQQKTVPQPDVAWVERKPYGKARPEARDVFLVIEIADSSLDYDTGEKADLYAAAGICDYWVVDIRNECIEIRRDPANGRYRTLQTFDRGESVRPLSFPDVALSVGTLFDNEQTADG